MLRLDHLQEDEAGLPREDRPSEMTREMLLLSPQYKKALERYDMARAVLMSEVRACACGRYRWSGSTGGEGVVLRP